MAILPLLKPRQRRQLSGLFFVRLSWMYYPLAAILCLRKTSEKKFDYAIFFVALRNILLYITFTVLSASISWPHVLPAWGHHFFSPIPVLKQHKETFARAAVKTSAHFPLHEGLWHLQNRWLMQPVCCQSAG